MIQVNSVLMNHVPWFIISYAALVQLSSSGHRRCCFPFSFCGLVACGCFDCLVRQACLLDFFFLKISKVLLNFRKIRLRITSGLSHTNLIGLNQTLGRTMRRPIWQVEAKVCQATSVYGPKKKRQHPSITESTIGASYAPNELEIGRASCRERV